MRLLIITQKVDRNDPVLGFFHGWIAEFSKRFTSVVAICLEKRHADLPDNVSVLSLGKEKGRSRPKYVFLLFYFSLRYANRYDAVFVHMNEEYVILAGWLWRLMGKKVYMWRNHHSGSFRTDVAAAFCTKVFCTSRYSYTAKYKKTVLMPVGISLDIFRPDPSVKRVPRSILFLGRIAPAKNVGIFIEALSILKERQTAFSADIYGDALPKDSAYFEEVKARAHELGLEGVVAFHQGVENHKTPAVYSSHEMYVNLSSSGMYDKTIFEAMACGCLALASNDNLKGKIDDRLVVNERTAEEVAQRISAVLSLSEGEKQKLVSDNARFAETQSLSHLSKALASLLY